MTQEADDPSNPDSDRFAGAMFDIEHALGMYASSFCTLPAEAIYASDKLAPLMETINSCHIYLIGYVPKVDITRIYQIENKLKIDLSVLRHTHTVVYDIPDNFVLKNDKNGYHIEDEAGNRYFPDANDVQARLSDISKAVDFDIKYIGQAYGDGGSRNALDRLLKHETLQKISLKGYSRDYRLTLLLLSIKNSNQLVTMINPFAKERDEDGTRVKAGLDKLFNTTEEERVALYEAALIRYFQPQYNKEFKNSFPSTNLKLLKDCYDKDFSAVVAEICIDDLPFRLKSDVIKPKLYHIAKHDLHKEEARHAFFAL